MNVLVPVLSLLSWFSIWLMAFLDPSKTLPILITGNSVYIISFFSLLLEYMLPFIVLRQRKNYFFILSYFVCLTIQLGMAYWAGAFIHRDFYTNHAQILVLYIIIFIIQIDRLSMIRKRALVYRLISIFSHTIFILWNFWLFMMFFAIVSRAEPRWIESSVYNILNLIIGLALLGATLWLNAHAKSRIRIIHDKVFLNQRDISSILSPQENSIILAFLRSHQNSLNCWELSLVLRTSDTEDESNHPHCKDCVEGFWKATSCSTYRNYKNRIKDVKKYLELSQIGTIVPVSENPREIKEAGWVLRFFDDVGLEKMPRLSHLFEHVPE